MVSSTYELSLESDESKVHASQFSSDTRGVQHCEQGISQPRERVGNHVHDVQGIVQVARNFDQSPGSARQGEEDGLLSVHRDVHHCPQCPHSGEHLHECGHHWRANKSNSCMEYFQDCCSLNDLQYKLDVLVMSSQTKRS